MIPHLHLYQYQLHDDTILMLIPVPTTRYYTYYKLHDTTLILIPVYRYTTLYSYPHQGYITPTMFTMLLTTAAPIYLRMPVLTNSYTYAVTYTTPITSTVLLTTVIHSCQYLYNTSRHSSIT